VCLVCINNVALKTDTAGGEGTSRRRRGICALGVAGSRLVWTRSWGTAVREMSKKGGRSGLSKSEVAGRDQSCLDVKDRILASVDWAIRPRTSLSFDTRLLFRHQNQYRRVAGSSVGSTIVFSEAGDNGAAWWKGLAAIDAGAGRWMTWTSHLPPRCPTAAVQDHDHSTRTHPPNSHRSSPPRHLPASPRSSQSRKQGIR